MNENHLSKQVRSYANVIVGQIGKNFRKLHDSVTICSELKEAIYTYRTDAKTKSDDLFSLQANAHKVYQKNIDDLVCGDYSAIEPLTVGIFGESGSGKTHNLKVIRSSILKNENNFPIATIPILFNAWRYEDERNIIIPLIKTLIFAIEDFDKNIAHSSNDDLQATISHLKVILYALNYGLKVAREPHNMVRNDTSDMRAQILSAEKLDTIYLNIPQYIEKIALFEKLNFIFLIDDLDRCLPENTLRILNTIELFLNVPPCAFVLTLNDDIIERGIAHHYKDYQNRDQYLYGKKESDGHVFNLTLELPITGDEYIEKMIQLPTRLPTINIANIRKLLQEYSVEWIRSVDKDYDPYNQAESDNISRPSEALLDFFTHSVPPKPRKIKRVIQLFESKLQLLNTLELEVDLLLLAKVTLLELFSPRLLRYIESQTKYHSSIWRRLEESRFAGKADEQNSLEDFLIVEKYLKKISRTEKFTIMHKKLMGYIKEHYQARDRFELDSVFDGQYRDDPNLEKYLKHILEYSKQIKCNDKVVKVIHSPNFEKLLFAANDPTAWLDAFREDNLFAEKKALLSLDQLDKIMTKARSNGMIKNIKWFSFVAKYSKTVDIAKFFSFDMGTHLVTFKEFDKYCDDIGKMKPDDNEWGRGLRPVINVSWDEAVAYAEWKSKREGVKYRLPTNAEWLLACNLGQDTKWHFGNDENMLSGFAWYRNNSGKKTHPIGNKMANDLGLYDMHGNVWEWCADNCTHDPQKKIVRGGSWNLTASDMHTKDKDCMMHNHRYGIVGFRLVREIF